MACEPPFFISVHLPPVKSFDLKLRILFAHFTWALFVMSLCRGVFYYFNYGHFQTANSGVFITGTRFDFSALFWMLLPYLALSLINLLIDLPKQVNKFRNLLFLLGLIVSVLFNLIDVEYYKFTLKRSTYDIFSFMNEGADMYTLIPQFLSDFWYLVILFIAFTSAIYFVHKKIENANFKVPDKTRDWIGKGMITLFLAAFFVIGGRGGLQLIPLGIVDAGKFTSPQNVPLLLNTPFSIIRTIGKEGIKAKQFYSKDELNTLFNPISKFTKDKSFQKKNVVIIILESFSMEYVSDNEKGKKLTPFLQKLKQKSEFYDCCFANGKKSIEALPAIMSGIPTWMNDPFVSSSYGVNRIESFATYLKPKGYHTSFFHGGKNGTMNFDGYISAASFDAYYGKDEYPNQNDYDGTWGIFDEPYLQYFSKSLSTLKEPFFSSVFSLSSHHPYAIPEQFKGKFTDGENPLETTIQYVDYSLEQFFISAEKEAWFNNTIFVITADHTPNSETIEYQRRLGMYHIPLFIYEPSADTSFVNSRVCQQIDILPSLLDRLNYSEPVFGFGKSIYQSQEGYAIQFLNNTYQIMKNDKLYQSNLETSLGMYNTNNDVLLETNLMGQNKSLDKKMDTDLKAVIQSYNERLINNKLTSK